MKMPFHDGNQITDNPNAYSETLVQLNDYSNCTDCVNSDCFIKKCSPKWLSIIEKNKNQSLYKKSQQIFFEGSPVFGAYFICCGKVKVVSRGCAGQEKIVRLAKSGHILGHVGSTNETYPIGTVALEDSLICFIDNNTLYNAFIENAEFMYSAMMFYSQELRKIENRIKLFSHMTIEEKVTYALYYIIEIFGYNEIGNSLNITLSRQEIANIVGTNAEQVSRTISLLKQNKIIRTSGRKIFIDNYEGIKNILSKYTYLN